MRKLEVSRVTLLTAGVASSALVLAACLSFQSGPQQVADASQAIPDRPDYNWDVRPILSQNCFACHGGGTRKAGLRLDEEGFAKGELPENKGKRAIKAGNPGASEIIHRIKSTDPDVRMPPKEAHKTLTPRQVAILERWIKQGAEYKQHWAYIPPKEVKVKGSPWDKQAVNQIDRFIFARLDQQGLKPSAEADRETLINRVTLDLTGLPPTLAEVDAFIADKDPKAYEKLVDRLLASRQYAERQANIWMDVARYADTRGGLNDGEQSIAHPYRDWVISAFQRNLPYDKFVTWQLAGDQLPNASREQILATGFIRAGKKDTEGGAIDEEFRTNYVNERAELVGQGLPRPDRRLRQVPRPQVRRHQRRPTTTRWPASSTRWTSAASTAAPAARPWAPPWIGRRPSSLAISPRPVRSPLRRKPPTAPRSPRPARPVFNAPTR